MDKKIIELIEYQIVNEISETEMCEKIGITRRTLNNLKEQKVKPHDATIKKIEKYLDK